MLAGSRLIERGDQVKINSGTYINCTGQVVFIDYVEGLVTVGLDQYHMMLKTDLRNIAKIPCNILTNVV